jgi:O-antigen/teichoic acid export membrane protein
MKRVNLSNSAYSVMDYVAQPIMMLLAAPMLLRHLGVAAYGVWLIASAAVGAGSAVSSGFGDAVIQRVATLRAAGDAEAIRKVIANMLAINLILSTALAVVLWLLVPAITLRITHFDPLLKTPCEWALRVGAVLIVIKSVEAVFISAQRAFERYAPAVYLGVTTRVLTILVSIALAARGFDVPALMVGAVVLVAAGTTTQWIALRKHAAGSLRPALDRAVLRDLTSFGGFSWLQAVSGVIFSQADRLLLGATLGASAVSYYAICVQVAQPIHGITAAGLHFLFPHLAVRFASSSASAMRGQILSALVRNVIAAVGLTTALILLGPHLLTLWMGPVFAQRTASVLPVLAVAFGMLALNVTGHYTLLALGKVRLVTALNVAGGVGMLVAMYVLLHPYGVQGAAWARLCYGPITCLMYVPLLRLLLRPSTPTVATGHTPQVLQGEA